MNDSSKPWYLSKGTVGSLIGLIASMGWLGHMSLQDQTAAADVAVNVIVDLGCLFGLIGRVLAAEKVKLPFGIGQGGNT